MRLIPVSLEYFFHPSWFFLYLARLPSALLRIQTWVVVFFNSGKLLRVLQKANLWRLLQVGPRRRTVFKFISARIWLGPTMCFRMKTPEMFTDRREGMAPTWKCPGLGLKLLTPSPVGTVQCESGAMSE